MMECRRAQRLDIRQWLLRPNCGITWWSIYALFNSLFLWIPDSVHGATNYLRLVSHWCLISSVESIDLMQSKRFGSTVLLLWSDIHRNLPISRDQANSIFNKKKIIFKYYSICSSWKTWGITLTHRLFLPHTEMTLGLLDFLAETFSPFFR